MNLLDNELVKKYFCYEPAGGWAYRVLEAMHQPIAKGERYLWISSEGKEAEKVFTADVAVFEKYHPFFLRLPDRFQTEEEKVEVYTKYDTCSLCKTVTEHICEIREPQLAPERGNCVHGPNAQCDSCNTRSPEAAVEEMKDKIHLYFQCLRQTAHYHCDDTNCQVLIYLRELLKLARGK
jgi:hypothetical protein